MLLWNKSEQYMNWYCSLEPARFANCQRDCQLHLYILQMLTQLGYEIDEKTGATVEKRLENIFRNFQARGGNLGL